MFSVDYATLRQLIQQFLYTGVFRAYVANPRLFSEEGHIELQAREGVVTACRFVTKQGKVYRVDRWELRLAQLGILNWELTTPTEAMPERTSPLSGPLSQQPSDAPSESSRPTTPHHTITLSSYQMRQWPMLYRQVYSLSDGRRQLSDIALVLHKTEPEIARIIDELSKQGLIEFK